MRRTAHAYYGKGGVLKHSLAAMGAFEELLERLSVYFPRYHRRLSAFLNEPVGGHPRYALLKWVELFHDVGKPATLTREGKKLHFYGHDAVGARLVQKIARRFRFSSAEERSLTRMVGAHMRPGNLGNQPTLSERAIHRFFRDLENDAVSMLVVALGDHFTYLSEKVKRSRRDPVFVAIRTLLDRFFLKRDRVDPPKIIDGHQLMKRLKLAPGPVIGDLLNEIREAQAAGEVTTVDEALAVARRRLASTGTA
jgi:tRNA nucleotidyltransferase/poly(A) polymerase